MDRKPPTQGAYRVQFTLGHLLAITALVAVALGVIQWATPPVAFLTFMQLWVALLAWTRSTVLISVVTLVIGSLGVLWMTALLTLLLPGT